MSLAGGESASNRRRPGAAGRSVTLGRRITAIGVETRLSSYTAPQALTTRENAVSNAMI